MTFICRTAVPSAGPGLVPARSRHLPGCLCDTAAVAIGNRVLPARPRGAGDSEEACFRRQARRPCSKLGPVGLGAAWAVGLSAAVGVRRTWISADGGGSLPPLPGRRIAAVETPGGT